MCNIWKAPENRIFGYLLGSQRGTRRKSQHFPGEVEGFLAPNCSWAEASGSFGVDGWVGTVSDFRNLVGLVQGWIKGFLEFKEESTCFFCDDLFVTGGFCTMVYCSLFSREIRLLACWQEKVLAKTQVGDPMKCVATIVLLQLGGVGGILPCRCSRCCTGKDSERCGFSTLFHHKHVIIHHILSKWFRFLAITCTHIHAHTFSTLSCINCHIHTYYDSLWHNHTWQPYHTTHQGQRWCWQLSSHQPTRPRGIYWTSNNRKPKGDA